MEFPRIVPLNLPALFPEITLGNPEAESFCRAFWEWLSLVKRFAEGKEAGNPERVIRISLEALATFSANPFWQAHKQDLLPLVTQAAKAYADAKRWEQREDFRDRATAEVLKAQHQEIFWHVAKLCGGYDHMDQMTQKYRSFDYPRE